MTTLTHYAVFTTHPGAIRWFEFKVSRRKQRARLSELNAGKSRKYAAERMGSRRGARDAEVVRRRAEHESRLLADKAQKKASHAAA